MALFYGFRHIKHAQRYHRIAHVLAKHGFGVLIGQLGFPRIFYRPQSHVPHFSGAERVRMALEELGPTYIKLGQLISTRPDLLPKEYIVELEKLQNQAPPFPFAEVEKQFARAGLDIKEIFTSFDETPIAAASIGQVHRARLTTGQEVAIKIQRPGIKESVEVDLEIIMELARAAERRTRWAKHYGICGIVQEFAAALRAELDFVREGRNAEAFRLMFKDNKRVRIPKVYWQYTTDRILVFENISGIKVSDVEALKSASADLKAVSQNIVDTLFSMVYEHGFFHADPHPGNMAVLPGNVLVFYDFGQVGTIDDYTRDLGMDLIMGQVTRDFNGISRALLQMGFAAGHVNKESFRRDVARVYRHYYGSSVSGIDMGEALAELVQLSFRHNVRLPHEMALMVKMLITMEGIVTQLAPDQSLMDIARPIGDQILRKRYAPGAVAARAKETLSEYMSMARNIPRQVETIMESAAANQFTIITQMPDVQQFSRRADMMTSRLSIAVILSALIVGLSMFAAALIMGHAMGGGGVPDVFVKSMPFAEIGFGISVLIGVYVLYALINRGKY